MKFTLPKPEVVTSPPPMTDVTFSSVKPGLIKTGSNFSLAPGILQKPLLFPHTMLQSITITPELQTIVDFQKNITSQPNNREILYDGTEQEVLAQYNIDRKRLASEAERASYEYNNYPSGSKGNGYLYGGPYISSWFNEFFSLPANEKSTIPLINIRQMEMAVADYYNNEIIAKYLKEFKPDFDSDPNIAESQMNTLLGKKFPTHSYFTDVKDLYDVSTNQVFNFLNDMPKGSVLHIHSGAVCDLDWILNIGIFLPAVKPVSTTRAKYFFVNQTILNKTYWYNSSDKNLFSSFGIKNTLPGVISDTSGVTLDASGVHIDTAGNRWLWAGIVNNTTARTSPTITSVIKQSIRNRLVMAGDGNNSMRDRDIPVVWSAFEIINSRYGSMTDAGDEDFKRAFYKSGLDAYVTNRIQHIEIRLGFSLSGDESTDISGSITGNTLTITSIKPGGKISVGNIITGPGITGGTSIITPATGMTGRGSTGTYTLSNSFSSPIPIQLISAYKPMRERQKDLVNKIISKMSTFNAVKPANLTMRFILGTPRLVAADKMIDHLVAAYMLKTGRIYTKRNTPLGLTIYPSENPASATDLSFNLANTTATSGVPAITEFPNWSQTTIGNLIVGFDLIAEEDKYNSTKTYEKTWANTNIIEAQFNASKAMNYYFHDGESNWQTNDNVLDAILFNTQRIGHGFNIAMRPSLVQELKNRDVCLEVCPISNQMLQYTPDIRGHYANGLFRSGCPIVLSNDDPAMFGYNGMTYDFFAAAVSWNLSYKALKCLAWSSVYYSSFSVDEINASVTTSPRSIFVNMWKAWVQTKYAALKLGTITNISPTTNKTYNALNYNPNKVNGTTNNYIAMC
jgi:hypothetical protein